MKTKGWREGVKKIIIILLIVLVEETIIHCIKGIIDHSFAILGSPKHTKGNQNDNQSFQLTYNSPWINQQPSTYAKNINISLQPTL